jgi:drug/metabolite transporter (DMT)-like permease
MAGFNVLLLASLRHADPAVVGSILGMAPVVMAIAGAARYRRWPARRLLVGASVVTTGVVLIEGAGRASLTGVLLAIGVLSCEIGFSLLAIPLLARFGPLRMSAYACLLTVPMLMACVTLEPGAALKAPSASELVALAWLAVIVTAMAFVCWYSGLARLGPERAGLFLGLVPVGALLTGLAVGLVEPTLWGTIGCLVCAVGIMLGTASSRNRGSPLPSPTHSHTNATGPEESTKVRPEAAISARHRRGRPRGSRCELATPP